jgi:hypothetical protein
VRVSGDTIRTIGSAVTVLVALGGIVWYIAGLDGRVRRLEEQVHTLTVAPTIAGTAGSSIPNPIAQACGDLARTAAYEASHGTTHGEREAEDMLKALGCSPTKDR